MRRTIIGKKLVVCALVCVMAAAAAGCGSKKPAEQEPEKKVTVDDNKTGQADTAKTEDQNDTVQNAEEVPVDPPAKGEMSDSETDALGNPINDDGIYYDESGNLVSPEDMEEVDEDGNPVSEEDMLYTEGEDFGWDSVEYGDKEAFMNDVKTGYEEVTEIPFDVDNTLYMLYANAVYEIQYENDTDFLVFCKGSTEEEVNRLTIAYDKEEQVDINGQAVNIYSYGKDTYLALWSRDGYWYSIYMDAGCTKDEMTAMAASVK